MEAALKRKTNFRPLNKEKPNEKKDEILVAINSPKSALIRRK